MLNVYSTYIFPGDDLPKRVLKQLPNNCPTIFVGDMLNTLIGTATK